MCRRDSADVMEDAVSLGAVTVLAVLEQAYFSVQVMQCRRKFSVCPPATSGPPEFERMFRAQANCCEYFPIFMVVLWTSGMFFNPCVSAVCGLFYLYGRLQYFWGYSQSAGGRLAPLHFSLNVLWVLIGFSSLGVLLTLARVHLHVDLLQELVTARHLL